METYTFKNVHDFVDYIVDEYNELLVTDNETQGVSIVAHYDECIKILNELLKETDAKLLNCEISEPEINGYYDAYVLTIDTDGCVWVQEANYGASENNPDGYLNCDLNEAVFIHGDVNCKFAKKNKDIPRISIFEIEDFDEEYLDENEDIDSTECDYCGDCDCADCYEDEIDFDDESESGNWFNFSTYGGDDGTTCFCSVTFSDDDFGKDKFYNFLKNFKF